ncbi:MAG TPA: hypothetical protein VJR50_12130, partial [Mycobacterium sp.]|nr:hypothetical protein [Mycobacterium sp.]
MGRVNRLTERRALRRAADQALLTSLAHPASARAGTAADQDFRYSDFEPAPPQSPETESPSFDEDPVTAPIPVVGVEASALPHSVPPWEEQTAADPGDLYDLVDEPPAEPRWATEDRAETPAAAPLAA